jgi:hypothetical protein
VEATARSDGVFGRDFARKTGLTVSVCDAGLRAHLDAIATATFTLLLSLFALRLVRIIPALGADKPARAVVGCRTRRSFCFSRAGAHRENADERKDRKAAKDGSSTTTRTGTWENLGKNVHATKLADPERYRYGQPESLVEPESLV